MGTAFGVPEDIDEVRALVIRVAALHILRACRPAVEASVAAR